MTRFLIICLAGALGTGVRYLVGLGAARWLGTTFPFGTLAVNVVGCFGIALVMQLAATATLESQTLRLALTTGLMGGLTTYSAFNYETTKLFGDRLGAGVVNVALTLVSCFVAGLLGAAAANKLAG